MKHHKAIIYSLTVFAIILITGVFGLLIPKGNKLHLDITNFANGLYDEYGDTVEVFLDNKEIAKISFDDGLSKNFYVEPGNHIIKVANVSSPWEITEEEFSVDFEESTLHCNIYRHKNHLNFRNVDYYEGIDDSDYRIVPDVVNLTYRQALAELASAGFEKVEYEEDTTYAIGMLDYDNWNVVYEEQKNQKLHKYSKIRLIVKRCW